MFTITAFDSDDFSYFGILCTRQCLNRLFTKTFIPITQFTFQWQSCQFKKQDTHFTYKKSVQISPYRYVIFVSLCSSLENYSPKCRARSSVFLDIDLWKHFLVCPSMYKALDLIQITILCGSMLAHFCKPNSSELEWGES